MESKKQFIISNEKRICMETIVPNTFSEVLDKTVVVVTGDGKKGRNSDTWVSFIAELINNKIGVVCFDFFGLGESDGSYEELNLTIGIKNLQSVLHEIKYSELKTKTLGVVGSSFGGIVSLVVGSLYFDFDFMVLKSPASILYESYEQEQGSYLSVLQWKSTGISSVTGQKYCVYLDALRYNVYEYVNRIKCKILIIHGNKDKIVPVQQSIRLSCLNNRICLQILDGVDHSYKKDNALSVFNKEAIQFIRNYGE